VGASSIELAQLGRMPGDPVERHGFPRRLVESAVEVIGAGGVLMLGRAVASSERAFAQGIADHFALASSLLNRGLALSAWGRPVQAQKDIWRAIEVTEAGLRDGSNSDALAHTRIRERGVLPS
jgi:hypothetical protein